MSYSKHTKGIWHASDTVSGAVNCGNKHIAMVNYGSVVRDNSVVEITNEEFEANLTLITRASIMYDALKASVHHISQPSVKHMVQDLLDVIESTDHSTPTVKYTARTDHDNITT
jgi:hypothetical protein